MSDTQQKTERIDGLKLGDDVGPYVIERMLGSGGMADVFYGVHRELNRPAAIKVLKASLAADEVHLQRFMQEARAAAGLIHPNIVQVYDVGREGESIRYIAQEYIPGSNLRQYLAAAEQPTEQISPENSDEHTGSDRQLAISETLSILLQVLAALGKSASSGIVHRDIKPENIMLTVDGEAKVADFGLARVLFGDDPQLTRAGTTLGTPMYMSPEQIQDGDIGIRSDLYSLGVTLFHMLAGQPPYTGETPLALAMQHVQAPVPNIRHYRDGIPDSLVHLVERLLAKAPEERFEDPEHMLKYLKEQRAGDLSEHWPDQTVPLPGAVATRAAGPLHATMMLQAQLNKKAGGRPRLVFATVVAVLAAGAFSVGAGFGYRPVQLSGDAVDPSAKIAKASTVKEQFLLALLSPIDEYSAARWRAVEYYYPGDGSPDNTKNQPWISRSTWQLAAQLERDGNRAEAEEVLSDLARNSGTADVYQVLAWLQLAEIGQENLRERRVRDALRIYQKSTFETGNKAVVDKYIKASPLLPDLWSAAQ